MLIRKQEVVIITIGILELRLLPSVNRHQDQEGKKGNERRNISSSGIFS